MAIVINPNEVKLNSIRYPLLGQVTRRLTAFPEKLVTGDYTTESNPQLSTWAVNDHRLGVLAEELDEKTQSKRAWWSTGILGWKGHLTLPRLATPVTAPATTTPAFTDASIENWTGDVPDDWSTSGAGTIADETGPTRVQHLVHSALLSTGAGQTKEVYEDLVATAYKGRRFTVTAYVWSTAGAACRIYIDDGTTKTTSTSHTGGAGWELLTVTATIGAATTQMHVGGEVYAASSFGYFDNFTITGSSVGTGVRFITFNNKNYLALGKILTKMNAGGTAYDAIYEFAADITDLVSDGTYLYIFQGDSTNYWYMSTADAFTQASTANAQLGIFWDNKLFKVNTSGLLYYSVTSPAAAGGDWTSGDTIPEAALSLQRLHLYRDASGDYIIYASTTRALWAYDHTNAKWIETELSMPEHPTGGKGIVHWREKLYLSAGLGVKSYQAAETAVIGSMGLDTDDGMPPLRGGEIVEFVKGFDEFFALVDSTYEGATSRSTVMAWDGNGWQCWWEAGTDNWNMYCGIVSSVVAYRLWFVAETTIYYIPLQRTMRNPKKVTGFTYATAGVHITPWFDANAPSWGKTAKRLYIKVAGASSDESVIMTYRIDHATTALAATWTTGTTITSDGVTTFSFGSGAGIEFKDIQFHFALAGGTSTLSPDIEWYALEYTLNMPTIWAYQFTVDCTQMYNDKSPSQLEDALKTAVELATFPEVCFRNDTGATETYNGKVVDITGDIQTGIKKQGQHTLMVVVP